MVRDTGGNRGIITAAEVALVVVLVCCTLPSLEAVRVHDALHQRHTTAAAPSPAEASPAPSPKAAAISTNVTKVDTRAEPTPTPKPGCKSWNYPAGSVGEDDSSEDEPCERPIVPPTPPHPTERPPRHNDAPVHPCCEGMKVIPNGEKCEECDKKTGKPYETKEKWVPKHPPGPFAQSWSYTSGDWDNKELDRCPLGFTECSQICVDTKTSHEHCGSCLNACNDEQKCIEGKCISPTVKVTLCPRKKECCCKKKCPICPCPCPCDCAPYQPCQANGCARDPHINGVSVAPSMPDGALSTQN
eukprot:GFYU01002093.1.p1 GENE.GFYU01002093.1~~GFYU01002093.1.p1  ORF type:complete len:301 (+),score=42.19 GFYU01002093.1:22-924(+)